MKPKIKRLPLVWKFQSALAGVIDHGGRRLVVLTSEHVGEWSVLAIEGAVAGTEVGFLDNHGHDLVGAYRSIAQATWAMEQYAEKWFKEKVRIERCACKALKAKRRSKK